MRAILIIAILLHIPSFLFAREETFILLDTDTHEIFFECGDIHRRSSPYCTFNIVLSLMGFDTKVLSNVDSPIWQFKKGYDDYLESWKTAQSPQTWMKRSCVWYSKELASQLGMQNIQNYLQLLEYGNQDMSEGLMKGWLGGSLKISAQEQIHFLQKMLQGELSISDEAIQMTKSILLVDELAGGWQLFGKTGYGNDLNQKIGWFVGWIEKGNNQWVFAYNIRDTEINTNQRVPRVKQLLNKTINKLNSEEETFFEKF